MDADDLIYARHAPERLPAWCRALLDPAVPLPADVVYLPRVYSPSGLLVLLTGIPAVLAVTMTVLDGIRGTLVLREWLALFPLLTLPLVATIVFNRKAKQRNEEIEQGRLRLGLFLTPRALLLRMTPDTCTMLPVRWISRFETTVLNPGRANHPGTERVLIYYRVAQGGAISERHTDLDCPQLRGQMFEGARLLRTLGVWLSEATGGGTSSPAPTLAHEAPMREPPMREPPMRDEPDSPDEESPVLDANGLPRSRWERHDDDGKNFYFVLTRRGEVGSSEDWRHNPQTEMAGSVTFDAFMRGEYQDLAQTQLGAVARAEIVASVAYLLAHPELLEKLPEP